MSHQSRRDMKRIPLHSSRLVESGVLEVADPGGQVSALLDCPKRTWELCRAYVGPGADREHFLALFVNANNQLLGMQLVSLGTLTASLVHPREVYKPALLCSAAAVIVAHNHPSGGQPLPSAEDRETTRRLAEAGKLLGMPLLDHLVFTDAGYFSFREHGLI